MLHWLRRIDDLVFGPPHTFETILAFVALRLGLAFQDEPEVRPERDMPSRQKGPRTSPSSWRISLCSPD